MAEDVLEKIKRIEERLDSLEKIVKGKRGSPSKTQPQGIELKDLLSLPSSLQKTMMAIQEMSEATSTDISQKTGRDRTVESIYLNQLARLGYLNKERRGHRYYFKVMRYY